LSRDETRHESTQRQGTPRSSKGRSLKSRLERWAFHLFTIIVVPLAFGCWEQIDGGKWFPQMKRQITIQAFEEVTVNDQRQGFLPPEGTVPVDWYGVPDLFSLSLPEQEALANPTPATLASLKQGEVLFMRYCQTCHGPQGLGDGPLAGPPFGKNNGPMGMVLPVGGPSSMARALSDGHIYTTISLGRGRMPNYKRITPMQRWDLINYIRDLNGQGGRS
jgi:mono/diheme cytochrome c family protein